MNTLKLFCISVSCLSLFIISWLLLHQKQHKIEDESPGEKFFRWSRKSIDDPKTCTYKQNKIQLEEEEEKNF